MTVSAHRIIRLTALMLAFAALAIALSPDTPALDPLPQSRSYPSELVVPLASANPSVANLPPLFGTNSPLDQAEFAFAPEEQATAADAASPVLRERSSSPASLPTLIGIVGRLPDDAEVLLRLVDGSTATLAVGEDAAGLRLQSVGADRAVFARGGRRIVLTMGED
ncbi:hypothetical protein G7A66_05040 [Altererythrobacter sp. SALINAS58]|uniref:hypothetical protein n=1 Tax=Alteripontixanthobacter muriae TaxID=2705546 RepID=UPI001575EA63|nr:hypothetical protein [Alteripontixanthobacter muriae]NTZ42461.1 hypothetical protein [Alteripontixanthobacter muriae]